MAALPMEMQVWKGGKDKMMVEVMEEIAEIIEEIMEDIMYKMMIEIMEETMDETMVEIMERSAQPMMQMSRSIVADAHWIEDSQVMR